MTRRVPLAEAWELLGRPVTLRRLRVLCAQGRVPSARRHMERGCPVWTVELRDGRLPVQKRTMGRKLTF